MRITNFRYWSWSWSWPWPLALAMMLAPLGVCATDDAAPQRQVASTVSSAALDAPPQPALTLAQAVEQALQRSPDLAVARREVEASEGVALQGRALPNPVLSYQVEDAQRATRVSTWLVSQPIELAGKRSARINASERVRDIARSELSARSAEIRSQVTTAFFGALLAQERVQLAQGLLALARQAADAVGQRVQAGKVSPVEETRARVAEAGVRAELLLARSELTVARQRLAAWWGDTRPQFDRVMGELDRVPELPELGDLLTRLSSAPTLEKSRLEIEQRKALTQLEQARRMPDLTLSLGMKRDEAASRDQAVVGFSLPIPLFDRNQGNVLEALRREDKAREQARALAHRLQADLMTAHGQLAASRQLVETLRAEVLPGANRAYEAVRLGFALGKFNFLDVLDSQRTLFQVRQQLILAQSDAHRAASDIDRLLGSNPNPIAAPIKAQ